MQKEDFKFNASHFVAFKGYRERLHGHNYKVGVRLMGERIQHDGYLLDFGDVKKAVRKLCKSWNEYVESELLIKGAYIAEEQMLHIFRSASFVFCPHTTNSSSLVQVLHNTNAV